MSTLGIFIISSSIAITASSNGNDIDAMRALGKATYVQSGFDKQVKELERKYINKKIQEFAGWMTLVGKITTEKRVSLEWKF